MKLHALNREDMDPFTSVSVRGVKNDKQYRTTIILMQASQDLSHLHSSLFPHILGGLFVIRFGNRG